MLSSLSLSSVMPSDISESGFVTFGGLAASESSVPLSVLTRTLDGIQKTMNLIAASDVPTITTQQRFRPTDAVRTSAELQVRALIGGSFIVPLATRDREAGPQILARLYAFLAAAAVANSAGMKAAIPDSVYRGKAIQGVLEYLPRPGDQWHIDFEVGDSKPIRLDQRTRDGVSNLVRASADAGTSEVIAELVGLEFARERVTLFYPPTNKKLTCSYPVDSEDRLIGSRRMKVKLIGLFERDANGHPINCVRVDSIEPFDLSPFEVSQVSDDARTLRLIPPLRLVPQQDEESRGSVLYAIDTDMDIHVYATSRDALVSETESQILFLWDAYAKADPATLDEGAAALAQLLRNRIAETPNDAPVA